MSLRESPSLSKHGSWVTVAAIAVAVIACVQIITGAAPMLWLLLACSALWVLLVQASHVDTPASVRIRGSQRGRPHRR